MSQTTNELRALVRELLDAVREHDQARARAALMGEAGQLELARAGGRKRAALAALDDALAAPAPDAVVPDDARDWLANTDAEYDTPTDAFVRSLIAGRHGQAQGGMALDVREISGDVAVTISQSTAHEALAAMLERWTPDRLDDLMADDRSFIHAHIAELKHATRPTADARQETQG